MAANNAEVIKEYLVGLGFRVDQQTLNKFDSALVKTSVNVAKFGGALLAAMTATVVFVDKVASKMADLYWSSVRLRDGAANIRDFQLSISKMGGTAEGALGALEALDQQLKTNPAAEGVLRQLGVQTRDAQGNLRGAVEILKDFAKLPMPLWLKVHWAQYFGIDYQTLMAAIRDDTTKTSSVVANMWKRSGVSADDATKKSAEFENTLKDQEATWNVLSQILATSLIPIAEDFLNLVSWIGAALVDLDKATGGWSTKLLFIGTVVGGLAIAFGWIPALIGLLVFAADQVYEHWDKIKQFFNGLVGWFRDKYNALAKYLGLPEWKEPSAPPAPKKRSSAPSGEQLPDFRARERGLDARSAYPAPGTATVPKATRIEQAMAYFEKMGWTPQQAAGIVSNLNRESGVRANEVGDNGQAYGAAQWHPDRQAAFAKWAGHDIRSSTLEEQLAFIQHELTAGNDKGARLAGQALALATTAAQAAAIISQYYERPADTEGEIRKRAAGAEQLMANTKLAPAAPKAGANVKIEQNNEFKINSSADANAVGRATARELSRVNGDLTRNMAGAVI